MICNQGRGNPHGAYDVGAEVCHRWRRDGDGVELTTCCTGQKRVTGIIHLGAGVPRHGEQLVLHPYVQTFCTGAQVVTHTCPPGPNPFTDLVLTCQPAPRASAGSVPRRSSASTSTT